MTCVVSPKQFSPHDTEAATAGGVTLARGANNLRVSLLCQNERWFCCRGNGSSSGDRRSVVSGYTERRLDLLPIWRNLQAVRRVGSGASCRARRVPSAVLVVEVVTRASLPRRHMFIHTHVNLRTLHFYHWLFGSLEYGVQGAPLSILNYYYLSTH